MMGKKKIRCIHETVLKGVNTVVEFRLYFASYLPLLLDAV